MDQTRIPAFIRVVLVIGLAVVVLGAGYMMLYSWLKPTVSSPAKLAQSPNNQLMQPIEPVDTPAPAAKTEAKPAALTFPIRGAFYYPWFPEAWKQQNFDPFTHYQPVLGYYDSSDLQVIQKHIAEMLYGKITVGISSWWGQGTETDQRFPLLLKAAQGTGFSWAIYYEMAGQKDTGSSQLHTDLAYIRDHYASDPQYLKINGRFLVFVYNPAATGCDSADTWSQANQGINAYLVLKVLPGYKSCPNQPDGWHQYAPAKATDAQGKTSFTISPGFWKQGEDARLSRDLNRWAASVQQMVASGAAFQLITSFNEWGEGTAVEPSTDWPSPSGYGAYLDVLHDDGGGQIAQAAPKANPQTGSNPAKAATPTSPPTSLPTPSASPTAAPTRPALAPSGADPVLLAVGDISSCSSQGDYSTAGIVSQYPQASIATLGDTVYEEGSPQQFATCFDPAWGKFKDRIRPAVGNHEYLTPNASGYYGYFGAAAGDPTQGYYSYDLGAWHVVVLNSNCSKVGGCGQGSPQEVWLKADLAAHPAQCTLAYWHHPRWSSGEHGDQAQVATLWSDLYDAGADLVLAGHDHDYQRFEPLDANGSPDPQRGMREFVVGTGGKNYYALNANIPDTSQSAVANVFGVLKLVLHPDSYDWQFLPEAGKTFTDSGSGVCH